MLDDDSCIDGHGDSVKLAEAIGALAVKMSASEGATCAATWLEKLTGVAAPEIITWVNMRAAQRNGAVVPTEPGLWWRDDGPEPCAVRQPVTGPLVWMWLWDTTHPGNVVKNDGHWIAPCVKPEVSNG